MAPPTPTSVMLVSGEYFDYLDPDPSVISLDVLEHGLAAPRFNNQTIRPISIAEHSMRVRRIARELVRIPDAEVVEQAKARFEAFPVETLTRWEQLPPFVQRNWRTRVQDAATIHVELWALNHDDHEALVPWGDCLRPGKTDAMREVETKVDAAIRIALGIALPTASVVSIVKTADAVALYFESMLWQPGARDWAPEVLGDIGYGPNPDKWLPLIAPRPGEDWRAEVQDLLERHTALLA